MCRCVEIDEKVKTVTIAGQFWHVMINNGKIISQSGTLSPVDKKKAYSIAHAIFPKKKYDSY